MITLKKLNGREIVINADLIETVEKTPDTVITLTNGKKMIVLDSPGELIQKVIEYKKKVYTDQGQYFC